MNSSRGERIFSSHPQKLDLRGVFFPKRNEIPTIGIRSEARRSRLERLIQSRLLFASSNNSFEQSSSEGQNAESNDHQRMPERERNGLTKRFIKWISERTEKRLNKNLTEIFTDPENHKKDIDAEVFRIFQQATASPLRNRIINTKIAWQTLSFGFAGEHAPIPIAFIPIPFLPLVTVPFLGTFPGWPITVSAFIGDTLTYNIPNMIQAFSEKRVKKGITYSAFAILCNLHIPFVFNSFWYEFARRPIERRHTIKFTEKMLEIIADPTHEHFSRFADTVGERINKSERRFHSITNLLNRLDTNALKNQARIDHHSERITVHVDHLNRLPQERKGFLQRLKGIFSKSEWKRWSNKAWITYHKGLKDHHDNNKEIILLARNLVVQHENV